jgi:hypothetical protein
MKYFTEEYLINNNLPDGVPVELIVPNHYVRRKADAKKTYRLVGWDPSERKYELWDTDDISRSLYVKKGTKLFLKFDY